MKKRLIAFLLVLIMVLGMLPVSAFAVDGDATKYTYTLYYKWNNGTDSTWSTEVTDRPTAATTFTFYVNGAKLTRDGYTFLGWADTADATTASYKGGDPIVLDKDNPTKTIYAVWEKNVAPIEYTVTYYKNDGSANDLFYKTDDWGRPSEQFNIYWGKPTRDGYDFVGWAETRNATEAKYASGGAGGKQSWIKLDGPKVLYAVWQEAGLGPEAPRDPSDCKDQLKKNTIKLVCVGGNHPDKVITFADVSYGSDWSMGDTCRLNFYAKDAALKYSGHAPKNPEERIYVTFKWVNDKTDANGKYLPGEWVMVETTAAVVELVDTGVEAPSQPTTAQLGNIKVTCRTNAEHSSEFPVAKCMGTTVGTVTFDSVKKQWYIDTAPMTTQLASRYDSWKGYAEGTHRLVNPDAKLNARFYYDGEKWYTEDTLAIDVCCGAVSEIPGKPDMNQFLGNVLIRCTTDGSTHAEKGRKNIYSNTRDSSMYTEVLDGNGDAIWKDNDGVWTYQIKLIRAKFVEAYSNNQFIKYAHTDTAPNEETILTWKYRNGAWELIKLPGYTEVATIIEVKCAETPVKPEKPTALDGSFAIVCKNNKATHPYKADYIATPSQYTISDVQKDEQGYYVTATVTVAPNLAAYNTATRAEHRLVDEQDATLTITFRYDTEATVDGNRKWKQQGDLPVVEVICKPKAPTADELKKLEMSVQVKCVVDAAQQHTSAYGLLGEYDKDYFVGEPKKVGDDWLCDISYDPDPYVAEFNKAFPTPKHIQNDEKIVPVTLIWVGDSWQIKTQGRVLVTEVYTVTFDSYGGTPVPPAQEVEYGLTATEPAAPEKTGYTFDGWYLGDEKYDFSAAVEQNITLTAKWEKKTYKVVAKLYVNGKPAYYQNTDFYTYEVSGLYGEAIDFDTIKAKAVEQAKQIKKASASYTAVILEDHEPNPVCTTFGEHQPGQAAHYVKVNVKTEENVVIFQSFEGKTDLTTLHTTTAPYGTNVVEFLNGLGLDLDVAGYTLDTDEDGNTNWYKKDSPKWTFGANDTINGWTNVLLKYTITPHNIYAYLRTGDSIGDVLELNEATLNRLGLTKYNTEGFISIGTFVSNTLLTQDEYYGFDEDEAFLDVLAELQTKLVPETGVSLDKVGSKINWSWLYQPSDVDDRIAGYPTEDTDGYQLSGSLLLYGAKFEAGANDVTGMPTAAYGAYLDYFVSGESFNLPAAPTRPGYDFKGWKIGNAVLTAGAAYTVDEDDMVFTAQWEARTDTPYTVEHYLENLDGSYALDTTEHLKGTTDTTVTAAAKSYDNFTYDSTVPDTVASGNIAADGSLVLKLFYTRNTYDYTVRHIKQLPDGSYDEANAEVETLSGKFEALAAVTAKDYGEHYPTNNADTKQNIKIEKGLTIDVKYDLDEHTLTFETNGGSAINPVTVRHGNAVARPADPTKDKYTFIGWYADPEFTEEYDFATVLEADKTIYAKFELTSTPIGDIYVRYDVLHIKQLPDGTYDLANAEVEHLSAKKDTTVTAVIKDYRATHHVNVNRTLSKLTGTAIQPYMGVDGKPVYTILSVYYDLDFHTLTFDTMGGSKIAPETVRHGLTVAKPKDPVNGGYIFDGWYTDKTFRTPYNFATPLTQDTTIYAKWFLIVLPGVTVKKNTPKLNTADHFAYVQGYPDGTVKPAGNITRAETAAILFRLMDDTSRNNYYSTKSGFRDVASGSWYNTYVATLNNAGVITDSSNGYFRPNEAITRAELAAMLAKFSETTGAANYFNDVSAKYWAANAIAICAKLGWITGYPDGTFRPDKNVTRAELMAMINRATGRAPKSADAFLPGMKTWIDNTSDKWYYLDVQEATNSHSYTVKGSETWTALTSDPNWSLYE